MMDPGATLGDELANGGVRMVRFQEFHQGLSGREPSNRGAIGVVEWDLGHPEDIAIEGAKRVQRLDRDPDVSDASTFERRAGLHVSHGRRADGQHEF
jgi:hypothetical protein